MDCNLYSGSGNTAVINLRNSESKRLIIVAAGFGEDEPAAIDVIAQFFRLRQQRWSLAAADVEDGRLQQVFNRCRGRIHYLPGKAEAPGLFGVFGEVGGVAAMLVPGVAIAILDLGHDDGRRPLERNSKAIGVLMRGWVSAYQFPFQ